MAVNNVIRMLNLTRGLNTDGDVDADSLADNFSSGPTITSIHPSANVAPGDTVYIVGTGFDRSANVILISNTNIDIVVPRGSITFNNSANLTFSVPAGPVFLDEDYDVRVTIDNTGLAAVQLDALDLINTTGFQGRYFGYTSGGSPSSRPLIDKFPFPSDGNATDVGDLSIDRNYVTGQSSDASGYTSGGSFNSNVIDKFPFASDGNATDVGDLTFPGRSEAAGQSSDVSGYTSGGYSDFDMATENIIDKFPFASDANASDVGDLTVARQAPAGQSSTVSGYSSGGLYLFGSPPNFDTIDKSPFATDANATDVGNLTVARYGGAGQSSDVSGYTSGGETPRRNIIDKFPFASDANATDVGDLTFTRGYVAGQSSTVSGYSSGSNPPTSNVIEKFPFASDANATDVGDLTVARGQAAGQQI